MPMSALDRAVLEDVWLLMDSCEYLFAAPGQLLKLFRVLLRWGGCCLLRFQKLEALDGNGLEPDFS